MILSWLFVSKKLYDVARDGGALSPFFRAEAPRVATPLMNWVITISLIGFLTIISVNIDTFVLSKEIANDVNILILTNNIEHFCSALLQICFWYSFSIKQK